MRVFGRSGRALTSPLCSNDLACTRYSEKRGQVSARTNPPIFMFLVYGRTITYLGAAGVLVGPHSNASLNHHHTRSSLK